MSANEVGFLSVPRSQKEVEFTIKKKRRWGNKKKKNASFKKNVKKVQRASSSSSSKVTPFFAQLMDPRPGQDRQTHFFGCCSRVLEFFLLQQEVWLGKQGFF